MGQCLTLERLDHRLAGYAALREATGDWPRGTAPILRQVLLRGEIPRGEVARLIAKSPRTAHPVIRRLLENKCLTTPSDKGPLRLGWPPETLSACLPDIFN